MAKSYGTTELSPPHVFRQISGEQLRIHSPFLAHHPFYSLGVCTSQRIHKMERMIYCQVYGACCRGKLMVCSPLVAVNDCPRPDMLSNDGELYCSIPFSHFHKKAISASSLHPSKDPCPSTARPLLYFLFPNLLSSISTSFPGPPITAGWSMKYWMQMSLIKLYQSTAVALATLKRKKTLRYPSP